MAGVLVSQALGAKMREAMYAQYQQTLEKENLKIKLKLKKAQLNSLRLQADEVRQKRLAVAEAKLQAVLEDENATEAEKALAKTRHKMDVEKAEGEYQKTINDLKSVEISIEGQLQTLGESQSMNA